jgi:hypothetical protein
MARLQTAATHLGNAGVFEAGAPAIPPGGTVRPADAAARIREAGHTP